MNKNKNDNLELIRDLGVMHLEKKTVSSPAITELLNRRTQYEMASGFLNAYMPKKKPKVLPKPFVGDLPSRVLSLVERRNTLQDYMFNYQRERIRFERWGEFNPKDFAYLSENGIKAYLYEITYAVFTDSEKLKDVPFFVLYEDEKTNVVRLLTFEKIPGLNPWPLPERALSVVEERNYIRKYEMARIEEELANLALLKDQLVEEMKANQADIEFETARASMESITGNNVKDVSISMISGYIPAPDIGTLKRTASEHGWALYADDPAADDMEVPTKLKNNKFAQLLYPLTDLLELIPGYREIDISFWFLLFFTLFFGMIFGDAAYGVILLLIAIIGIAKTSKKKVPLGLKFLLLMSISNVTWGVLVCSWFGLDTAMVPQFLQNLSLPLFVNISEESGWLASYNAGNFWIQSGLISPHTSVETMGKAIETSLMFFCFSIALVHMSIAHIQNTINSIRSPKALAEIGRLGMLLGMYFIILSLVVFNTGFGGVKTWQYLILVGGFGLVFIFGNYEGNLVKAILSSCSNFITVVLSITNVFSDIMSYIRLWAVGQASASIAAMVNNLVGPLFGRAAFFVLGIVFFAFGHVFNMVLNVLAVLVHGVRLNMLEFSSHVGVTWCGFAYKPFAKR